MSTDTLQEVPCSDQINTFETRVALEYIGNPDAVTDVEVILTQNGFGKTYNKLAENFCDPLFRNVTNATVVAVQRDGDDKDNIEFSGFEPEKFRFVMAVSATCRNCRRNTPLFDDAVDANRRRVALQGSLLDTTSTTRGHTNNYYHRSRHLDGICLCVDSGVNRAPREGEYTVAYNEWLENAQAQGKIDPSTLQRVVQTIEQGQPQIPSTSAAFSSLKTGMHYGGASGEILFVMITVFVKLLF